MIKHILLAVAGLDAAFTGTVLAVLGLLYIRETVRDWRQARRAQEVSCEPAIDYRSD